MTLLVGLGNPGDRYEFNRHNAGFLVLDALAERLGNTNWQVDPYCFDSQFITTTLGEQHLKLMKPGTFINESGKAVAKTLGDAGEDAANLWVIHDDTEIPLGEVRVKFAGTSGGHNGIKSLDDAITPEYWRIRIGVGRPENREHDLAAYVLANFTAEEEKLLQQVVDQTVSYLIESLEEAQINATSFTISNA